MEQKEMESGHEIRENSLKLITQSTNTAKFSFKGRLCTD